VELFLDPDDSRSQKVQLYEQLRSAIVEGRLTPGDRLTPSRIVAADLHISRATITEAYGRLGAEGYIEGRSGGGSRVTAAPMQVRRRSRVAALEPTRRAAGIAPYALDPTAEGPFDCRPGYLDLALFPVAAWRRCVQRTLNHAPGVYGDPGGTPELRAALANWVARSRGVVAAPEDNDSEFRHTARPLEPLQRLDRDGRVIYVGTFSKSLSPGLRVGFLVAPRTLLPALHAARQAVDWCPPPATQAALTHFIVDGYLDQHLRRTRRSYAKRHRLMREALDRFLPADYRRLPAEAGLHVTVTGPADPADPDVAASLRQASLLVSSLRRTYAFGPPATGLLLGYAGLPTGVVVPAVRALSSVLAGSGHPGGAR
jgi:DNA-binding transcriptional MocR family regulator